MVRRVPNFLEFLLLLAVVAVVATVGMPRRVARAEAGSLEVPVRVALR
jgi:hypothetical protein